MIQSALGELVVNVPPVTSGPRFRLATLMSLIALVAALLGLWRAIPVLGAMMVVPAAIALGLTVAWSRQRFGRAPSTWQHVRAFALILGIEMAVMASSAIAFLTTCAAVLSLSSVGGSNLQGGSTAAGLGVIAGIIVPIALIAALRVRSARFRKGRHTEKA